MLYYCCYYCYYYYHYYYYVRMGPLFTGMWKSGCSNRLTNTALELVVNKMV